MKSKNPQNPREMNRNKKKIMKRNKKKHIETKHSFRSRQDILQDWINDRNSWKDMYSQLLKDFRKENEIPG